MLPNRTLSLAALISMATSFRASAQQYAARRTVNVVQLEDARNQTIVSIVPSAGNVTGAIPIHGFLSRTDQWQVMEVKADGKSA